MTTVGPRFAEPAVSAAYERDGFVVLDLLSVGDLDRLRALFGPLAPELDSGFTATLRGRTLADNLEIGASIADVVEPRLRAVLEDFRVIGATFLSKGSGDDGLFPVHQDWNSVDERVFHSMNVWCPLDDVELLHGPLEVLAGSHLWFESLRAPTVPSVSLEFSPLLDELLHPVAVSAGQVVIYDHRLFHGSRANRSNRLRAVAQLGIAPEAAPLAMGFATAVGEVELRQVEATTFFEGLAIEAEEPAELPGVALYRTAHVPVTEAEVTERIARTLEAGRPPASHGTGRWRVRWRGFTARRASR